MEAEQATETLCFFKKLDDGQSPQKEDCQLSQKISVS
jgi:hypothetical protein